MSNTSARIRRKATAVAVALGLSAAVIATPSKHAEAILGVPGMVSIVATGLVIGAPMLLMAGCMSSSARGPDSGTAAFGMIILIGIPTALVVGGIVLADTAAGKVASFGPLDPQTPLGDLTHRDIDIYNSEIDRLNLIAQSFGAELSETGALTPEQRDELWNRHSGSVSPETWHVASHVIGELEGALQE